MPPSGSRPAHSKQGVKPCCGFTPCTHFILCDAAAFTQIVEGEPVLKALMPQYQPYPFSPSQNHLPDTESFNSSTSCMRKCNLSIRLLICQ